MLKDAVVTPEAVSEEQMMRSMGLLVSPGRMR